ncbi:MAG: zinc ribbon domain-containing protein [Clostridia bacterium]|nr:zinc ribbon domain-containing protein [Clostridia bacterium]
MSNFCGKCGTALPTGCKFCPKCGTRITEQIEAGTEDVILKTENSSELETNSQNKPESEVKGQGIQENTKAPQESKENVSAQVKENKEKKQKKISKSKENQKKGKKKKSGCLKFFVVLAVIALIIVGLWYSVGNYFTLMIHTNKVLEVFNSGSLDFSEFQNEPYEELPLYVREMMGEQPDPDEQGPIITAMNPYLHFERVKISGFFGKSDVVYKIVSRDIESWILSLDYSQITSTEQLQEMILDYIPTAPVKEYTVIIHYTKDGMFNWRGEYETPEFANAITGGLNSAYNELYIKMIEEMEEIFG